MLKKPLLFKVDRIVNCQTYLICATKYKYIFTIRVAKKYLYDTMRHDKTKISFIYCSNESKLMRKGFSLTLKQENIQF